MWFLYALLSALLASFRNVSDKQLSASINHLHLAWMLKAAALPVLALLAFVTNQLIPQQPLPAVFWIAFLISIFITAPIDIAMYLQSLKYGQLSKVAPLLSLWPVIMLLSGAFFLKQIPSLAATFSILVIVAGVYILNTSRGNSNMFRNAWTDRGTRFGFANVLTLSVNATVATIAIAHSSPLFYAFWACLGLTVVQFFYAQIVAPGQFLNASKKAIFLNGTIQGLSTMFYCLAIATGPIGYVAAIRSQSSTVSAVLGAKAFDEGLGRRKVFALCLVSVGVVLLALEAYF